MMEKLSVEQQMAVVLSVLVLGYRNGTITCSRPITARRLATDERLAPDCKPEYRPQAVHELCTALRERENGHWAIGSNDNGFWLADDLSELDELVERHKKNIAGAQRSLALIDSTMKFGKDGV